MRAVTIVSSPFLAVVVAGAFSCNAQQGETTVPQLEERASALEASAVEHEASYDPNASVRQEECEEVDLHEVCWTSVVNPTAAHKEEARRARKLAAEQRTTAQALRDAEGKACLGVSARNRDLSPFARGEDIAGVEREGEAARVRFHQRPGLDRDALERMVACHVARNQVLGGAAEEMPYCPLTVPGVLTKVSEDGGLTVLIEVGDGNADALAQRLSALEQRVSQPGE